MPPQISIELADLLPDGLLLLSRDGAVLSANRAAEKIFGTDRQNLAGRRLQDFCAEPPDRVQSALLAWLAAGSLLPKGLLLRRADGSEFSARCDGAALRTATAPSPQSIVCMIRPRSAAADEFVRFNRELEALNKEANRRRALEEKLLESERRYRLLAESTHAIPWEADAGRQNTAYIGPQSSAVLGYSPQDWRAKDFWIRHVHPEDRDEAVRTFHPVDEVQFSHEYRFRHADGHHLWIQDTVRCSREAGQLRLRGFSLEITARKQAEEDRLRLQTQAMHTQRLESLGVLAGGIAHDFNNLLAAILGNAELVQLTLADEPESAALLKSTEFIKNIEEATARATHLTRQLLIYAGRTQFVREPLDLNQMIRTSSTALRESLPKNTVLDLKLGADLPLAQGDEGQLRQALLSLASNAVDSMPESGGKIGLTTGSVPRLPRCERDYSERSGTETGFVFLEVTDSGCGLDPAQKDRIFDPFYTTKFAGRGLGLATVLGVARSHQGAIQVESTPARGSRFRLFIPCSAAQAPAQPIEPAPQPADVQQRGAVLVVDDEEPVRVMVAHILREYGFACFTAASGEAALECVRSQGNQIQLVILDRTMPGMTGEEAGSRIKLLHPEMPLILSSGYSELQSSDPFPRSEIAAFLPKPYRIQDLIATVYRVLAQPGAAPSSASPSAAPPLSPRVQPTSPLTGANPG